MDINEEERQKILDEFFDSIEDPERRLRLRQLQFRIDGILRKYKNPIARAAKANELMMDKFIELNELLQSVTKGNR